MKSKESPSDKNKMLRTFKFKIDKKDYIRSMVMSNNERFLFVSFSWNKNIRVFNLTSKKEEGKISNIIATKQY